MGGIYASWFDFFVGSDPSLIQWGHLTDSSMWANGFTLLAFVIPMCVWTARRSLHTNPTNHLHYARAADYTLHSFSDEMGKHYPHVRLFRKINLTARSIDEGKYRMPDTEKQFAMKHALLDRTDKSGVYRVNSERATAVFREQLGTLWRSFSDLSKWEIAVLSVLMPRIAATDVEMSDVDYKAALETTNRLVASYWEVGDRTYNTETDTLDVDVTEGLAAIRKYYRSPKVAKYFKKHAYVYTIMYAMLNDARSLGVLPSNELRWLRVVDRRLWLVINNVGRTVAWTEVSGVYGHYVHELKKRRSLEKMEVGNAVKGLCEGVEGYRFGEDEIAKINAQLHEEEKAKMVVDPKAVAKERKTLILGSLRVRHDGREDFLEVALIGEDGSPIYSQRCQPSVPREAIERDYHLTDEDVSALLKMPLSQDVRKRLIELTNGQDVVAFYRGECALVPGLDRSAASVRTLEDPDDGMDLRTAGVMDEVIDRSHEIHTAVDAAQVARLLWIELRKVEMRAAQGAAGPQSS
ncbi:hypothetical protein WK80_16095 [Burkholderia multivorans]|uniref:secretion/conjugation apparatus DotM-related subunit n=1 Tax=Burkholderia cepacia complex TaxID=87882 RepID=UPI000752EDCC|nr:MULTISPECIES: hypothetical protein [Burkholderia cepacia complex]KVV26184.1 hypothetical protein WK80_16095 [Burkholderia multivorans]MDN8114878.1 hypothetical protein [Burkholderia vietnamiensis]HDR9140939.1 hypothetical protein [Burkholderia vietnamiensis]